VVYTENCALGAVGAVASVLTTSVFCSVIRSARVMKRNDDCILTRMLLSTACPALCTLIDGN
jgi:hypothetical protein